MRHLLGALSLVVITASGAAMADTGNAIEIGAVYRCPSAEGRPDVLTWVERLEPFRKIHGKAKGSDALLLHVQMRADDPEGVRVGHAPFASTVLTDCAVDQDTTFAPDPAAFQRGYRTYADAVVRSGATYFTRPPAEAYWLLVGVMDGNGGES